MKAYPHLAEPGLALTDLSLRLYSGSELQSSAGVSLTQIGAGADYVLDGLPELPGGVTVTMETPDGVFHAYRIGTAATQPADLIIPIREVFADPTVALEVMVFRDGEIFEPVVVEQISDDGEYLVSGWSSPSARGESWRVRWVHEGQAFAFAWTGSGPAVGAVYVTIGASGGSASTLPIQAWSPESFEVAAVEEAAS